MGEKCLQRYFFIIRFSDGREHGDYEGTVLANDGAAREYAVRIISELIDGGGYDDPGLSMIVKDAADGTKEHRFVRADTHHSRDAAIDFAIQKAKQIIDLQGERIFM